MPGEMQKKKKPEKKVPCKIILIPPCIAQKLVEVSNVFDSSYISHDGLSD